MTHGMQDETEAEADIRKKICNTCEGLGLSDGVADEMADRFIWNLRGNPKYSAQAAINKRKRFRPERTYEVLVTSLLKRWQDR